MRTGSLREQPALTVQKLQTQVFLTANLLHVHSGTVVHETHGVRVNDVLVRGREEQADCCLQPSEASAWLTAVDSRDVRARLTWDRGPAVLFTERASLAIHLVNQLSLGEPQFSHL